MARSERLSIVRGMWGDPGMAQTHSGSSSEFLPANTSAHLE